MASPRPVRTTLRVRALLCGALALLAAASCRQTDVRAARGQTLILPASSAGATPAAARAPRTPAPPSSGSTAPAPPGIPSLVARSAFVVDAATGEVLFEKNADTRWPVASTQKLLTALVVLESGGLDRSVTVAKADTEVEPRNIGLSAGDRYTRRQLLEALLVRSGNDVAHCLARSTAGSVPAFATRMNRHAQRLGMVDSRFVNASGLTAEGQYSTARDLGTLARTASRNPFIASTTRRHAMTFHFADGTTTTLKNTNELLEKSPYCHGMKTGFTKASGRCLVSCGSHNGKTVIVVVLRSGWDSVWTDSKKLLHWGLGVS